jgi:56kDa selenium binding protein (SBP56)
MLVSFPAAHDLHDRPNGPARAHEVRLQGGDCTTEIFQ